MSKGDITVKFLNLGCGSRINRKWTNVDFHSGSKDVLAFDLKKGIPFEKETFDVVYHSHLIEHFSKKEATFFLSECHRVLKHEGVLRIAYPDLEQIVLNYIRLLEHLKQNKHEFTDDYDWIMLELFDQTVRNTSGGEMAEYFIKESLPNQEFVLSRCGVEAKNLIIWGKRQLKNEATDRKSIKYRIIRKLKILFNREFIIKKMLGKEYKSLQVGRFRMGGEIHQWMYDSYSMKELLNYAGFRNIVIRDAFHSYIQDWQQYLLDTEPDGSIYKPDSGYIEGKK